MAEGPITMYKNRDTRSANTGAMIPAELLALKTYDIQWY